MSGTRGAQEDGSRARLAETRTLLPGGPLPGALLDQVVDGSAGARRPLRQVLGQDPCLLVFLRHFGWLFTRDLLRDLRRVAQDDSWPRTVLVHLGTSEQAQEFLRDRWPRVEAVADPTAELFDAFGLQSGTATQLFGLASLKAAVRSAFAGHFPGKPMGDVRRMPGMFLLEGDRILWVHRFEHAGDKPDVDELARTWRSMIQGPGSRAPGPVP